LVITLHIIQSGTLHSLVRMASIIVGRIGRAIEFESIGLEATFRS